MGLVGQLVNRKSLCTPWRTVWWTDHYHNLICFSSSRSSFVEVFVSLDFTLQYPQNVFSFHNISTHPVVLFWLIRTSVMTKFLNSVHFYVYVCQETSALLARVILSFDSYFHKIKINWYFTKHIREVNKIEISPITTIDGVLRYFNPNLIWSLLMFTEIEILTLFHTFFFLCFKGLSLEY